ncbi:ORF160 [Xestia c-nigrum granulovirus]|uniref:ORF160 n=1 Tax=Xestia c-nigrum granulosis virus TaxID=51677 RepID=Q9PYN6_GVXN|nr:ORF160 [Xestia c-nigrum granulovirus]AAF05274.1 ORF160 [Xestia c-nigrum granulovirus]
MFHTKYDVNNFYNSSRSACKSTTLYNGNMPQQQFTSVIQNRGASLVCYESMPTSAQKHLHLHKRCHNKENDK